MNRRTFLATTEAVATAVTMKAASAATVTPFGQTGAPTPSTDPLPLGPLSGSRYPDSHLESVKYAQYEAASAYIKSQAHAGWTLIRSRYDDTRCP
jgi:hypothetical protein